MNIKELAEQAGFRGFEVNTFNKELERFAELIRADEREACAKLCDDASLYFEYDRASPEYSAGYCAKEIRSRK